MSPSFPTESARFFRVHEAECNRLLALFSDKLATGSFADAQEWWSTQAPVFNAHYGMICGLFAARMMADTSENFLRFAQDCGVSELQARHYAGIARNLIEPSFP
jgi:hypothetical protein